MTHAFERTALILLAGAALTACASAPQYPITQPVVQAPPPPAAVAPAPSAMPPPGQPAAAQVAEPTPGPQAAAPQATAPQTAAPQTTAPQTAAPQTTAPQATAPQTTAPPPALAGEPAPPPAQTGPTPTAQPTPPAPTAAAPAPEPPRAPVYRTVTTRTVSGKVVDVEGPAESYTVRKGDTLEKIASKLDTEISQLARDNGLRKPYRLQPGQVLKGPRGTARAYVVGQGDTLFSIARRFNVSVDALRSANDLGRNAAIAPGRKLRLPAGYRDRGPIVTTARVEADVGEEQAAAPAATPVERRAEAPPPVEEPEARTVSIRSVTGRVVEVSTPGRAYKVRKGDTLEKVARKLDSDIDDLARINRLKKPYRLQPGQTIHGPGGSAKAYVVGSGDTLGGIARRFDVSVEELRAANGLRRGASVAPGRRLRLPAGYRDRGPIVTTRVAEVSPPPSYSSPTPPTQAPPPSRVANDGLPSAPQPYTARPARTYTAPRSYASSGVVPGAPTPSAPVSDAQIMQMGRGLFAWPIRGDVLSAYGGKASGQRNDGMNIRASTGDPVRAAAAGDVVYAGDQVPGFGNLVLLKHADGWVTAYGHLARVDVRMQQKVGQGQQIGQAGSTGGVGEPQLHFEVRYAPTPQERARPVDPELVLPR